MGTSSPALPPHRPLGNRVYASNLTRCGIASWVSKNSKEQQHIPHRRRWFVLFSSGILHSYHEEGATMPLAIFDVRKVHLCDGPLEFSFAIMGPYLSRAVTLVAANAKQCQRWREKIVEVVHRIANHDKAREVHHGHNDSTVDRSQAEQIILQATPGVAPPTRKIGLEDFEELKVIGQGAWGKVSKVKMTSTGEVYAMKMLHKEDIKKGGMSQQTMAEKTILTKLSHPFIVKLHYAFQTHEHLYLILELLPGGELFWHLQTAGRFSECRARLYAAELASALVHLHGQDIVYRDLKPENIVLDRTGHVCLTDFGLARALPPKLKKTYTFCGTPEYLAPEIILGEGYDESVDWWAYGVLLYEMLTGCPPFYSEDEGEMYDAIVNKPVEFPDYVSDEAKDLISKLLSRDAEQRIREGDDIQEHPFFASLDWNDVLFRKIEPEFVPDLHVNEDRYMDAQAEELEGDA